MNKIEIFVPINTANLEKVEDLIIHLLFSEGIDGVTMRDGVVFKLGSDGVVHREVHKIYSCIHDVDFNNLIPEIKRLIPQSMVHLQSY